MDSSEFESVFQNENLLKQKLHDGKYFSIEKVKISHRWEIKKSIQEKVETNLAKDKWILESLTAVANVQL